MFALTPAQIHLAVNHFPVLGALFATVALAVGAVTRRAGARNLGLGLLVCTAVSALPTYFSGEGAEDIVEDRPGVSESLIARHEAAAERALAITLAAGLLAASALSAVQLRRERAAGILSAVALLAALASSGLMWQAAHLGGLIRHDELRASPQ